MPFSVVPTWPSTPKCMRQLVMQVMDKVNYV